MSASDHLRRALGVAVLPVTRRVNFPGKRRLRNFVRVPESGMRDAPILGGSFRVDMTESMQRDYWFGVYDHVELGVVRRMLANGGDFVDVGGHVGTYTVVASRTIGTRGRVLVFEPNPTMRELLNANIGGNGCANVVVSESAVSDAPGRATLHVPRVGDVGWSSLSSNWVGESTSFEVDVTTLDAEVERLGLKPAAVKIDVESYELHVLRGATALLEQRPAVLMEVVDENTTEVVALMTGLGYLVARAGTRRLEPWPREPRASNAVFLQPRHLELLRPRERQAFGRGRA